MVFSYPLTPPSRLISHDDHATLALPNDCLESRYGRHECKGHEPLQQHKLQWSPYAQPIDGQPPPLRLLALQPADAVGLEAAQLQPEAADARIPLQFLNHVGHFRGRERVLPFQSAKGTFTPVQPLQDSLRIPGSMQAASRRQGGLLHPSRIQNYFVSSCKQFSAAAHHRGNHRCFQPLLPLRPRVLRKRFPPGES